MHDACMCARGEQGDGGRVATSTKSSHASDVSNERVNGGGCGEDTNRPNARGPTNEIESSDHASIERRLRLAPVPYAMYARCVLPTITHQQAPAASRPTRATPPLFVR